MGEKPHFAGHSDHHLSPKCPGLCILTLAVLPGSDISPGLPFCRLTNFEVSTVDSWEHRTITSLCLWKSCSRQRTARDATTHSAVWPPVQEQAYFSVKSFLMSCIHSRRTLVKPVPSLKVTCRNHVSQPFGKHILWTHIHCCKIFAPLLSLRGR